MSLLAEFERDAWEARGGWRDTRDIAADVILLFFADEDEEDDLEGSGETREECPLDDGRTLVVVARRRHFRLYQRDPMGAWVLREEGAREFTERIVVGRRRVEA